MYWVDCDFLNEDKPDRFKYILANVQGKLCILYIFAFRRTALHSHTKIQHHLSHLEEVKH